MGIKTLQKEIRACQICKEFLPNAPKPIFAFTSKSKILIIGQAPGRVVHEREVPFDDKSGDSLRDWLGLTREEFYDPDLFAIVPMGFCFPGKGKSGDLPPRKECAPQWHDQILDEMKNLELVILIGTYAQNYYLKKDKKKNLTETVGTFDEYLPKFFPIVHPSGLNFRWQARNSWFKEQIVPILKLKVDSIIRS